MQSEAPVISSTTAHFVVGSGQPHSLPGRYSQVPIPLWVTTQTGPPPVPLDAVLETELVAGSPPAPVVLPAAPPVPPVPVPVVVVLVVPAGSKLNVG